MMNEYKKKSNNNKKTRGEVYKRKGRKKKKEGWRKEWLEAVVWDTGGGSLRL